MDFQSGEVTHDELIDAALSLANTDNHDYEAMKNHDFSQFQGLSVEPLRFETGSFNHHDKNWPTFNLSIGTSSLSTKKESISDASSSLSSSHTGLLKASPRKKMARRKSSSFRGVSYNIKAQRFKSVLTVNKKQIFLGYFENEEDAARAYDEASKVHKGPYARLNFGVNTDGEKYNDEGDEPMSPTSPNSPHSPSSNSPSLRVQIPSMRSSDRKEQALSMELGAFSPLSAPFSPLSPGSPFPSNSSPRPSSLDTILQLASSNNSSHTSPTSGRNSTLEFLESAGVFSSPLPRGSTLSNEEYMEEEEKMEVGDSVQMLTSSQLDSGLRHMRPQLELNIPDDEYLEDFNGARKRLKSEESLPLPPDSFSPSSALARFTFSSNPPFTFVNPPNNSSSSRSSSPKSISSPIPNLPWAKTSRYRGVSFNKNNGKYKGVLTFKGKQIFLGYFDDEVAAARAYDDAVLQYRGTSSSLNFPQVNEQETKPKKQITSKYRGVSWCKMNKKFKSVSTYKGAQSFNGYFDTEEDAAKAYDRAMFKHKGVAAQLNFPELLEEYGRAQATSCITPRTAELVEKSSRLRIGSVSDIDVGALSVSNKSNSSKYSASASEKDVEDDEEVEHDKEDDEHDEKQPEEFTKENITIEDGSEFLFEQNH